MKNYFLLLLSLIGALPLSAQINLDFRSQVEYQESLNDIWGYVAPDNREYALVGLRTGVSIVDVTDPANPILKGEADGPASTWRDMKTFGTYAYVTNDDEGGLLVIDLANLPNPITEDDYWYWEPTLNGQKLINCHNIYIDDAGYAYLAGCNLNTGGMLYVDVFTNPGNPILVGPGPGEYSHDVYVRDNIMYSSEINAGVFTMYDVSDKLNTIPLASQSTPFNFTHNAWLSDDGDYLFTTDEKPNAPVTSYDISDPNNIKELDQYKPLQTLTDGVIPHNVHVWENWLIISYYTDGCILVDATRPNNLVEVGNFDTFLSGNLGSGFSGSWGAYPYLPSGVVLVSDINSGLYVFEPTYVQACYLEGNIVNDTTLLPIKSASIEIMTSELNQSSSDILGDYATGLLNGGTFNVRYSHPAYESFDTTVTLENGILTQVDVQLKSLVPSHFINLEVLEAGTGNPVPNAKVILEGFYGDYEITTNISGTYSNLSVFQDDYVAYGGKWGYVTNDTTATITKDGDLITVILESGYNDNFAIDLDWETFSTSSGGKWERAEPIGTFSFIDGAEANPEFDVEGDLGDQCYVTGNGGGQVFIDDVDQGFTWLTSPVMDLSNLENPVLEYQYWFYNAVNSTSTPNDNLTARVSNGTDTVVLEIVTASESVWRPASFTLKDFIDVTDEMRIIFESSDQVNGNTAGHWVEAGIDVFNVYDTSPNATFDLAKNQVELFATPNPFDEILNVQYQFEAIPNQANLRIYNILGQTIDQIRLDNIEGNLAIKSIQQPGIYFLQVEADGAVTEAFKVVKN